MRYKLQASERGSDENLVFHGIIHGHHRRKIGAWTKYAISRARWWEQGLTAPCLMKPLRRSPILSRAMQAPRMLARSRLVLDSLHLPVKRSSATFLPFWQRVVAQAFPF